MKFRKEIIFFVMILVIQSGCSNSENFIQNEQEQVVTLSQNDAILEDSEGIAELYRDIYEQSVQNEIYGLDREKQIVQCLGKNGYVAVDNENQLNMVNSKEVTEFVENVKNGKVSKITIICVILSGGFIRYDLQSENESLQIIKSLLIWEGDNAKAEYLGTFSAHTWNYSSEGYLFFEQYRMPGFDGPSGHTAIRVRPLDENCREMNRRYLMPIGYELNNLFTTDWNENDYGELNFYDIFDSLYQINNNSSFSKRIFEEGISYELPKLEFEKVLQEFFQINSLTLQQGVQYNETMETYQYRTRGIYDCASTPNIPYPEVVSYEEKDDGTFKLMVNAVWPEENLGKVFSHEVVIRPLEGGKFQYVSNRVIPSAEKLEVTWYTERLTDEEWKEFYGGGQ